MMRHGHFEKVKKQIIWKCRENFGGNKKWTDKVRGNEILGRKEIWFWNKNESDFLLNISSFAVIRNMLVFVTCFGMNLND